MAYTAHSEYSAEDPPTFSVVGELDRGGAINTITPANITSRNATGMATSGFLVDIEKADIDRLRRKYPESFKRAYHPAAGLNLQRVLVK
jgi:trimethylamine-N-oxide reductase (cytochrome c)